ncbi:hypothetical protein [Parabacteroides distasonis]|uniref:hypothetical protein n=1 Tax=Parabacteroides distasonis TaxID=823 RepID=UPI002804A2B4|nr:hypothetical protein [Parabacteroides distasonis]WMI42231.1 hypothetical protein Q8809_20035 [Parabacteroides distasonis]
MNYTINTKAIYFFYILLLYSCQYSNKRINFAIEKSSSNKQELKKVLNHYKDSSIKYKAAIFLIENMPFHYNKNNDNEVSLDNIYNKHIAISQKYDWIKLSKSRLNEINSLEISNTNTIYKFNRLALKSDIETFKSEWLIKQIDLAFEAWNTNIYTKEYPFDIFCEFILPYRFKEGIILDDSKTIFHKRHHTLFKDSTNTSFIEKIDSILYYYKDIKFNDYYGDKIPINSAKALEQIKYGQCGDRSWFNSLVLASSGVAASIDFAPSQGNRNNSHTWNAIITPTETIPFEPFWDEDRWKYKIMYNNKTIDRKWGKLRFAKVYRKTFSLNETGPLFDPKISKKDIPNLFRNPAIKDVSHEYFDTTNVRIQIPKDKKESPYYAYLCVYNHEKWEPIQWGKISRNHVTFLGMGRDVLYLPAFYVDGNIQPIDYPFYISPTGEKQFFPISNQTQDIYVRSVGFFRDPKDRLQILNSLSNTFIIGVNEQESIADTLYTITDHSDLWENTINIQSKNKYNYIELQMPSDTFALCDLTLYTQKANEQEQIHNIKIQTPIKPINAHESIELITDHISATGMIGTIKKNSQGKYKVKIDLGGLYDISTINYIPYTPSTVQPEYTYTLYYWDQEWKLFNDQKGNNSFLIFKNVPCETIYMLSNRLNKKQKNIQRIFSYKNGYLKWL